jgi:hypothetical protein
MPQFPAIVIDRFIGMDLTKNKLSLLPGQLMLNDNYLYLQNGGLQERGGGAKLSDPPSAGVLYGLGNYINENGSEYLVTIQGTDAYYYDSGWNALSLTLTSNKRTRFQMAGAGSSRALYGVNGADSTDVTAIATHKNRLFATSTTTLYFTETNAFDTWNTGTNTIDIAPGLDGDIQALEIWGDSLFIFKETGVYVLPNAADASPTSNWKILRTDAITGTLSPDTVKKTKDGIYYLATDNVVRQVGPATTFSSAEYTLGDSGSPTVSYAVNEELQTNLDASNKGRAFAIVHEDLYVMYWQSTQQSGSQNDRCFFADTGKRYSIDGIPVPQPYWGSITGALFDFATHQFSGSANTFYGVGGSDGVVQECFNVGVSNDAGNAIASKAILGWISPAGDAVLNKMKQVKLTGDVEGWSITLRFDGYDLNGEIPSDGSGTSKTFDPHASSGISLVGTAVVGTATVSSVGIATSKFRLGEKGYFFKIEMENLNIDEPTKINQVVIYFRPIKKK